MLFIWIDLMRFPCISERNNFPDSTERNFIYFGLGKFIGVNILLLIYLLQDLLLY